MKTGGRIASTQGRRRASHWDRALDFRNLIAERRAPLMGRPRACAAEWRGMTRATH
jgi:hypothetical protein